MKSHPEPARGRATRSGWAAACRGAGVTRTVKLTDALIAATAIEHGLPVVTRDQDYAGIAAAYVQVVAA